MDEFDREEDPSLEEQQPSDLQPKKRRTTKKKKKKKKASMSKIDEEEELTSVLNSKREVVGTDQDSPIEEEQEPPEIQADLNERIQAGILAPEAKGEFQIEMHAMGEKSTARPEGRSEGLASVDRQIPQIPDFKPVGEIPPTSSTREQNEGGNPVAEEAEEQKPPTLSRSATKMVENDPINQEAPSLPRSATKVIEEAPGEDEEPPTSARPLIKKQQTGDVSPADVSQGGEQKIFQKNIQRTETQKLMESIKANSDLKLGEDSDEGQGRFLQDADNGLSWEKMDYVRSMSHPREVKYDILNDKTMFGFHGICSTSSGWPHCKKAMRKSDFREYGVGIVLYFQFLKFVICYLFIFTILSIPNFLLFYYGPVTGDLELLSSINFSTPLQDQNLTDALAQINSETISLFLSKFTLGNVGERHQVCTYGNASSHLMNITCNDNAILSSVTSFGAVAPASVKAVGCKPTDSFTYVPAECSYYSLNETEWAPFNQALNQSCFGTTACTLNLTSIFAEGSLLPPECSTVAWEEQAFQLNMQCLPQDIVLPFLEEPITREMMSMICVMADFAISVLLYFSLLCLKNFQDRVVYDVQESILTADDFTVCFKTLPPQTGDNLTESKAYMWTYVENLLKKEKIFYNDPDNGNKDPNQDTVMNVYFGVGDYWKMNHLLDIAKDLRKKKVLDKRSKLFGVNNKDKIRAINEKALSKFDKLREQESKNRSQPVITFIQFQSMNGVRKFYQGLNMSKLYRGFLICTCRGNRIKHKYIEGKIWPKPMPAPEPSLILWNNLGVSGCSRWIRTVAVNIISITIIVIGFLGISYGKRYTENQQTVDSSEQTEAFDYSSCDALYGEQISQEEAVADYNDSNEHNNVLGCYCFQQVMSLDSLDSLKNLQFEDSEKNLCLVWLTSYLLAQYSTYLVAGVITLINMVQLAIFSRIAVFERNQFITDKLTSALTKMFLVQYVNIGVIVILMYANVEEVELPDYVPILQGQYKKFNLDWYKVVGSTLMMTMIIQIIAPHASYLVKQFIKQVVRCCDRKCRCDERRTMQILQEDYENKYMGLEFEIDKRYSQMLSQLFIVMTFASGIPLLYPVGMLCAFMNYWTDKYLFLRLYKRPPLYDDGMAVRARTLLKVSIAVHCLMSFYIYSNGDIMSYTNNLDLYTFIRETADGWTHDLFDKSIGDIKHEMDNRAEGVKDYFSLFENHSIMQLLGLCAFLFIVILEEVFGVFTFLGQLIMFCTHNQQIEIETEVAQQKQRMLSQLKEMTKGGIEDLKEVEVKLNQVVPFQADIEANTIEPSESQANQQPQPEEQVEGEQPPPEQSPEANPEANPEVNPEVNPDQSPENPATEIKAADPQAPGEAEAVATAPSPAPAEDPTVKHIIPVSCSPLLNPAAFESTPQENIAATMKKKVANQIAQFRQSMTMKRMMGESFSVNVYSEISIENLRKEYIKTVYELIDYKINQRNDPLFQHIMEADYRGEFRRRLKDKLRTIKLVLREHIKARGLRPEFEGDVFRGWAIKETNEDEQYDFANTSSNTDRDFNLAFENMKNEANYYRLRSVYCYDIMEHPTFKQTTKIVARIRKMTGEGFQVA